MMMLLWVTMVQNEKYDYSHKVKDYLLILWSFLCLAGMELVVAHVNRS